MIAEMFKEIVPELKISEPMSNHTTFKIGGIADMYVSVKNSDELSGVIKLANEVKLPFTVIGNGSNILVGDKGIRGIVIEIGGGMNECTVKDNIIYAESGILLSKLASVAAQHSLSGMEEISGVPGTLGGGIYMNAGAYGGEIKDIVRNVTYVDALGTSHTVSNKECGFGYRTSVFADGGKYIVSAELELKPMEKSEIQEKMNEYKRRRAEKQPISFPSAGSTFKRPAGNFAGTLIEQAGLKGYKIGGAMVSTLHAGFVINSGGATSADVRELIKHIQNTVKEKFGIELEPEVKFLGEQ